MKAVAWYSIIFIELKFFLFPLGFATPVDAPLQVPATIFGKIVILAFEIPVLIMAVWTIRGKSNKVLAWYAVILYALVVILLIIIMTGGIYLRLPLLTLVLHIPLIYLAVRIIRIK